MRLLIAAILIYSTMAVLLETCLPSDRPRIVHGISISQVFAYPSLGGFVCKRLTPAELDWLDLKPKHWNETSNASSPIADDKMHASDSDEEENAFALRLMQLGGRWWPSQKLYNRHPDINIPYGHHYPPDVDIGYTSEGIFVLRTRVDSLIYYGEFPDVAPEKPETWSRLSLCATIEERGKVLRDFGAVLYDSVEECPDLPSSIEGEVEQGKYWAELLRKTEDPYYMDQWLSSL